MAEDACVTFLQWALPQLNMRWPGFRKVRGQVCKRIKRRINELDLPDLPAYQTLLQSNHSEWQHLDGLCRITISRFYRDKEVFAFFGKEVLPALIHSMGNKRALSLWCIGAASGEEPYSLAILWHLQVKKLFPKTECDILASEIDPHMLERARLGCYEEGNIKNLPKAWLHKVFTKKGNTFYLKPFIKEKIRFIQHDIREAPPKGTYQAVFCRNLVFTYFNMDLQTVILEKLHNVLDEGGVLAIGGHETLPSSDISRCFMQWKSGMPFYRKI